MIRGSRNVSSRRALLLSPRHELNHLCIQKPTQSSQRRINLLGKKKKKKTKKTGEVAERHGGPGDVRIGGRKKTSAEEFSTSSAQTNPRTKRKATKCSALKKKKKSLSLKAQNMALNRKSSLFS